MSHQNRNKEYNLLVRFLDGELSPVEERDLLHLIAEDDELRSMLRFDRFLLESLKENTEPESFSVPDGFSDDVMSQIHEMEEELQPETSWADTVIQKVSNWFIPREYSFRPAMVFAVPAILIVAFAGLFQTTTNVDQANREFSPDTEYIADQQTDEVWIRFVYLDEEAVNMAVAGNFSDWEPIDMTSQMMNGKKVWTGLVPVQRGEHHYMFIKDGEEWISDPLAEIQRDDGFGNKNAVIYL